MTAIPNRIVLMGHSAGASHVAGYLFHKQLQPADDDDGVLGAILLSGGYDPTSGMTGGRRAYYGEDQSLYAARSPLRHVAARATPIFIGFAEYDPPRFQIEAINLFKALCERDNRCPPMKQLRGHNHMTEVYHIGTTDGDHSRAGGLLPRHFHPYPRGRYVFRATVRGSLRAAINGA